MRLLARAARRARPLWWAAAAEIIRAAAGTGWAYALLLAWLAWLAVTVSTWMAASSAKTVDNTARINGLVGAAGAVNTTLASLQSQVSQLNTGTFTNISSGNTLHIVQASPGTNTLHAIALASFADGTQAAFLAGLGGKVTSPGGVADDPNSGSTFVSGERAAYINDLRDKWNALLGDMIAKGYMT